MRKATSIYLSEKDLRKIEFLKGVYETENTSELIRLLIEAETHNVQKYQELNMKQ